MEDSAEFKTLINCTKDLSAALKGKSAHKVFDTFLNGFTGKNNELIRRIKDKVRKDKYQYIEFVGCLIRGGSVYQPIVNILIEEYQRQLVEQKNAQQQAQRVLKAKTKEHFARFVKMVAKKLTLTNCESIHMHIITSFGNICDGSTSVTDIMACHQLSYFWFTHIDEIAKMFAPDDAELAKLRCDYNSKLTTFKNTIKIIDFKEEQEIANSNSTRYDHHKLTVKLSYVMREKTLDYIDQLWRSISDHFLHSLPSALLDSIHGECMEVTWLVPTQTALSIRYVQSISFWKKLEVIKVTVNGETVYDADEDEEMVSSPGPTEVSETLLDPPAAKRVKTSSELSVSTSLPSTIDLTVSASASLPSTTDPTVSVSTSLPSTIDPTVSVSTSLPSTTDPTVSVSTSLPSTTDPTISVSTSLPSTIDPTVAINAFRCQHDLLLSLICHCLPSLASSLYAKFMIPEGVKENACNSNLARKERGMALLDCVQSKIEENPSNFSKFVVILGLTDSFLKSQAEKLVENYNYLSDLSSPLSNSTPHHPTS